MIYRNDNFYTRIPVAVKLYIFGIISAVGQFLLFWFSTLIFHSSSLIYMIQFSLGASK